MTRYRVKRVSITHPLANINSTLAKNGLTVEVLAHRIVLWDKIGPGSHTCHWCGQAIGWFPDASEAALVSDHVNGDVRDNSPENLVPSCSGCNANRANPQAIQDDEPFIFVGAKRYRAVRKTCGYCGREFLITAGNARKGLGGFCSHSCAAKGRGLGGPKPPAERAGRTCEFCGTDFLIAVAQLRRQGGGRFCSTACRAKGVGLARRKKK